MRTIKPTKNRLLIAPIEETLSPKDIIIPGTVQRGAITYWQVLAVGPRVTEIVVGDRIVAPLIADHLTLPDGRKIIDASSAVAVVQPSL